MLPRAPPASICYLLVVLGRVTGCLYVAVRRSGEAFDTDERAVLTRLTREAANAFCS